MRPQTISEVIHTLKQLEKEGYGNHILLVSDDEECNGFHELYGWEMGAGEPFTYYHDQLGERKTSPTIKFS